MKKLTHHHPRGLIAAIAVLACCTGSANATVEQNKGTNAIAFSEQRGDQSANLVLSTLDLAMMDPVERDNMLASLETQYGKPKVWASRKGRSTSTSAFTFGRDGNKEKYGVRLRARQALPSFNSDLAQVVPAEKVPAALGDMASADLLGVERSEVLTWSANQDDYLGEFTAITFIQSFDANNWWNPGFNYKANFGSGVYSPTWYGFSLKGKVQADLAGRLEYRQVWFNAFDWNNQFEMIYRGQTRDVTGSGSLGGRMNVTGILSWGHDFLLWPYFGYWGLGAEASVSLGGWPAYGVQMISANTDQAEDRMTVGWSFSLYVEAQGSVWIGSTEHKDQDDDTTVEGHKLIHGAKGQIVFQGNAGVGLGYMCKEYDWYNDKWNNTMSHHARFGNSFADGKLVSRVEFRYRAVTFQEGYRLWSGRKSNDGIAPKLGHWRDPSLDLLL